MPHTRSSQGVTECLTFESPPATPEQLKKFSRRHNGRPGIKVIHPGLQDQKLPPSSHVYGIKLSEHNVQSAIPEVTRMLSEAHQTELGRYIKEKDEIHYKRHKMEPLGKCVDRGHVLPAYTKEPSFAFGVKSESANAGTKELIQIHPDLKIQPTLSRMSMEESVKAEKEVIAKRDYFYDWKALKIDPKACVFGKPPPQIPDNEAEKESVSNAMKFGGDQNKPRNPVKTAPMPEDFVYGNPGNGNAKENGSSCNAGSVRECIHTDVEERRNIMKRDQIDREAELYAKFGGQVTIPSRLQPNRVTAQHLLNPSKYAKLGVDEFTKHKAFDDIVRVHEKAGYPIPADMIPQLKQVLAERKYQGVCSLDNFNDALKQIKG